MNFRPPLLIALIILSIKGYSQKKNPSVVLYDQGNAAVAVKNYRAADSLFTLSLKYEPHPDTYYNRAVCRRQLNDFTGYCLDLSSASAFHDVEAGRLYWKQCAKKDTIYKKINGEPAIKTNFETVEYITSNKFNTDFEYEKLDTSKTTIVSKIRKDNEIIYRSCNDVTEPNYKGGLDSLANYIRMNSEFTKQVLKNNLLGVISVLVLIDENGKVKSAKSVYYETDPAMEELLKTLLNTTEWTAASYNGRGVKFQARLSVTYYDQELLITDQDYYKKHKKEGVVEIMPEFPGGMAAMGPFIQKNLVYPQMAKEAGLSGKCFLRFVILPNGKITNITVLKGVPGCPECDREAIKVILLMPPWKPGTQNGKPVSVFFNMPFNFQLR